MHIIEGNSIKQNQSILVLLSGGIDSIAVAELARAKKVNLLILEFDYPGRCHHEVLSAKRYIEYTRLDHLQISLPVHPSFITQVSIASDFLIRTRPNEPFLVGVGVIHEDTIGGRFVGTSNYFHRIGTMISWGLQTQNIQVWLPLSTFNKNNIKAITYRSLPDDLVNFILDSENEQK